MLANYKVIVIICVTDILLMWVGEIEPQEVTVQLRATQHSIRVEHFPSCYANAESVIALY